MAHQIILSDDDYATLAAAANQRRAPIEALLHEAIAQQYAAYALPTQGTQQGVYSTPTRAPLDPKLRAENERIARSIGGQRPWASEMVSEDRGPR